MCHLLSPHTAEEAEGPRALLQPPLWEDPAPSNGKVRGERDEDPHNGRREVHQAQVGLQTQALADARLPKPPGSHIHSFPGRECSGKGHPRKASIHSSGDAIPFAKRCFFGQEAAAWSVVLCPFPCGVSEKKGGGVVVATSPPGEKDTHDCTAWFCTLKTEGLFRRQVKFDLDFSTLNKVIN